jgi:hypothetical protein
MKYAILVREYQSNHEIELCEVGSNPDAIVKALREKTLTLRASMEKGGRRFKQQQYATVRWVEKP